MIDGMNRKLFFLIFAIIFLIQSQRVLAENCPVECACISPSLCSQLERIECREYDCGAFEIDDICCCPDFCPELPFICDYNAFPVSYSDSDGDNTVSDVQAYDDVYANITEDSGTGEIIEVNFSSTLFGSADIIHYVNLTIEHNESDSDLSLPAEYNVWNGSGWISMTEDAEPSENVDFNFTFNLSEVGVNTPDQLNDLGIRWRCVRSGGGGDVCYVDAISLSLS